MTMIPFICLTIVCVGLGVVNTIFHKLNAWKGIVVRGLFILSLISFAMIVSNLNGINNALTLFITIGLSALLLAESVFVSMSDEDKFKPIVNGTFFAISNVLFALSLISLAEFSVLALFGGVLTGIGFGLIVCVPKKNKGLNRIIMNVITFASIGLLLGLGVNAVLTSKHMISAVLMLIGGVMMLAHRILVVCGHGKIAGYLTRAFNTLALIAITISIYFY